MERLPMERLPMERLPKGRLPMERLPMERLPKGRLASLDRETARRMTISRNDWTFSAHQRITRVERPPTANFTAATVKLEFFKERGCTLHLWPIRPLIYIGNE